MADLDLDITPVVPGSASPEVTVNAGFDKVKAALMALNEALGEGGGGEGGGLPPGGSVGQFLALLAGGVAGWVDPPSGGGGGGGGGETVLASAVLTITDPGGTIVEAQSRKNNIASVTRISAGKFKFTFTKPLPDLFVHVTASCMYGPFDDEWATYVRMPRRNSEKLTVNQVTFDCVQQNGAFYDPVRLEFKITAFAAEITTPVEPGVSAKNWRVLFPDGSNGGNPNSFMRLTAVEFRKVAGVAETHNGQGTPLFAGTPVEPMSNAFDGNASTYWDAQSDTAIGSYCGFSFTDARSVAQVAITSTRFETFAPYKFKLQYMDESNAWVDVYTSAPLTWSGDQTKLFDIP